LCPPGYLNLWPHRRFALFSYVSKLCLPVAEKEQHFQSTDAELIGYATQKEGHGYRPHVDSTKARVVDTHIVPDTWYRYVIFSYFPRIPSRCTGFGIAFCHHRVRLCPRAWSKHRPFSAIDSLVEPIVKARLGLLVISFCSLSRVCTIFDEIHCKPQGFLSSWEAHIQLRYATLVDCPQNTFRLSAPPEINHTLCQYSQNNVRGLYGCTSDSVLRSKL
jgi:hypothetical protein